jgi:hypothetical protein
MDPCGYVSKGFLEMCTMARGEGILLGEIHLLVGVVWLSRHLVDNVLLPKKVYAGSE